MLTSAVMPLSTTGLGLPLGLEAPMMLPNGVTFLFLSTKGSLSPK